jgi:peptidoglycan/LPS O-acetylase OafA/YrhL
LFSKSPARSIPGVSVFMSSARIYRPDIDGLRAIAVLAVVAYHAAPGRLSGGFVGVDIFFVISGFLISSILLSSLENGSFSILDFYGRRVRRIFPALLIVMSTCALAGWFLLLPADYEQLGKHIAGGAVFVSNFTLWSESGYFDTSAIFKPLLHLWSLGIEEQFYIFWPIILWIAYKKRCTLPLTEQACCYLPLASR